MTSLPQYEKATLAFILTSLGVSPEELHAQGIAPQTLVAIYHDFLQRKAELTAIAQFTAYALQGVGGVHTVRYRVKDPIHLLHKVIRKKTEYPDRALDQHNYLDWINDLAGVRVLHLYKESWQSTGKYIQQVWDLKRPPIAYLSPNSDSAAVQAFSAAGADIRWHDQGYRAVHFVISTQPHRQRYFVEVQLRTLFEEGWSEIDHTIRYPDHTCNAFARDLLSMLNRLTGQADEVAAFIKSVYTSMQQHAGKRSLPFTEKEVENLTAQVEKLPVTTEEKQVLRAHIQRVLKSEKNR